MLKVTYLQNVDWFDDFESVKSYFGHKEAESIQDLNLILEDEAGGMASPIIEERY